jgi:hypothetical protein
MNSSADATPILASAKPITLGTSGTTIVDMALPGASMLIGSIVDQQGSPIDYAGVTLYKDGQALRSDSSHYRSETGQHGTFVFGQLAPGTYTVCVDPGSNWSTYGYQIRCFDGLVLNGTPTADDLSTATPIDIANGEARHIVITLRPASA